MAGRTISIQEKFDKDKKGYSSLSNVHKQLIRLFEKCGYNVNKDSQMDRKEGRNGPNSTYRQ